MRVEQGVLKKFGLIAGAVCAGVLLYFSEGVLPVFESDDSDVLDSALSLEQGPQPAPDLAAPPGDSDRSGDGSLFSDAQDLPSDAPESAEAPSEEEDAGLAETVLKEHRIQKGDSLYLALSGFGVGDEEIDAISRAIKPVYDLRQIRPGQILTVSLQAGSDRIDRLVYEIDLLNRLKVERADDAFSAVKEEVQLDRELAHRSGTITDSLYVSGLRAGVPVEVIMNLADIFAWDLDFGSDIHPGDQFTLIFEVYKKDGVAVRSGRVLAAEMTNRGRAFRAYYFAPPDGKGDYYDQAGRSLRKAFLKSPLRYRYISSGYATRRLHPILKVNRPHLGIDFAARHGTPVRAAADGVVSFAGWKGGHGKTVIIRHPNGYKTLYGHLSAFWPGLKKGKRVKQEDFIGKVGSTGLSTGPHLHYTLIKNGKAINPKAVDHLRGETLPEQWRLLFSDQVQVMDRLLDPLLDVLPENEST